MGNLADAGLWIDRGVVLGALGGLVGFFASGVVHYNWGDSEVVMVFYFMMGLSLAVRRLAVEPANFLVVEAREAGDSVKPGA